MTSSRDILRLERFGAVHYARASARFEVLDPSSAALAAAAVDEHAMDAWKASADGFGLELPELIVEVARLQDLGILDEEYRCAARVVRAGGDERALHPLHAPLVTNIQLTRACNLHCDHCFVDVETKPHPRELSLAQLDAMFGELQSAGAPLVLLAGGEPMMRKDFWDIVAASTERDLDAALCTNATMIDDKKAERLASSGIRWFSVSLDGPSEELHDAQRGRGSFARTVAGVKALMRAGAPGVKLRVTVSARNAAHLAEFAQIARELAVPEIVFKPFRHTTGGAALTSLHLYIPRAEYLRAVEKAREAWPSDAPTALWDDGMPETLPAWTGVTPSFGCVGGTTHASVIYDGRIVACDAVHDDKDWFFHDHPLLDAWHNAPTINAWRHLEDSGHCSSCGNFSTCGGGCRARALAAGYTIHDPDPWSYCETPQRSPLLRILH